MTKQDSLELKGIAILMMLFLHLFNTPERVDECTTFLHIGSKPLALLLSRVCGMCVPIFIFITGYGLAASWRKDVLHQLHPLRRVSHLYGMYWTIFLLFISLACYLSPSVYPGSLPEFIENLFCLTFTYNGEWWFMRSYIILVLLSPWIVGTMMSSKRDSNRMLLLATIGYIIWGVISKTHWKNVYIIDVVNRVLQIYLPFAFGIWTYYTQGFNRLHDWLAKLNFKRRHGLTITGVAVPLLICIICKIIFLKAIMMIPFVLFYLQIKRTGWLKRILCYLGRHSTYMWLTHTFFCYYLFHDEIYGLRYPLLIYGVLIALSLMSSYLCGWVHTALAFAINNLKTILR